MRYAACLRATHRQAQTTAAAAKEHASMSITAHAPQLRGQPLRPAQPQAAGTRRTVHPKQSRQCRSFCQLSFLLHQRQENVYERGTRRFPFPAAYEFDFHALARHLLEVQQEKRHQERLLFPGLSGGGGHLTSRSISLNVILRGFWFRRSYSCSVIMSLSFWRAISQQPVHRRFLSCA